MILKMLCKGGSYTNNEDQANHIVRYICTNGTREKRQACSPVAEGKAFALSITHNQALFDNNDSCKNVVCGTANTKAILYGVGRSEKIETIFLRSLDLALSPLSYSCPTFLTSELLTPNFKRTIIPKEEKEWSHPTYLCEHYYKPLQKPPSYEHTDLATASPSQPSPGPRARTSRLRVLLQPQPPLQPHTPPS